MGRFETELLSLRENLIALMNLSGAWLKSAQECAWLEQLFRDLDSSQSETYGDQQGSAYNGYFDCTFYHPLFVFNQLGDLAASGAGSAPWSRELAAIRGDGGNFRFNRAGRSGRLTSQLAVSGKCPITSSEKPTYSDKCVDSREATAGWSFREAQLVSREREEWQSGQADGNERGLAHVSATQPAALSRSQSALGARMVSHAVQTGRWSFPVDQARTW